MIGGGAPGGLEAGAVGAGTIRGVGRGTRKALRRTMQEEMRARGAWGGQPKVQLDFGAEATRLLKERGWNIELEARHFNPDGSVTVRGQEQLWKGIEEGKVVKKGVMAEGVPIEDRVYAMTNWLTQELNQSARIAAQRGTTAEGLVDYVARGTWFHGRGTYPKGGERLAADRMKTGNLGEPMGVSLSALPEVAEGFARKTWKDKRLVDSLAKASGRLDYRKNRLLEAGQGETEAYARLVEQGNRLRQKYYDIAQSRSIARAVPLYGASPKDVILPGWKGSGKEGVLKEAYEAAVRRTVSKEALEQHGYAPVTGGMKHLLETGTSRAEFNKIVTEELQARGYKGILYSPHRYGEYELRMFDPKDVLLTDLRRKGEAGVARYAHGKEIPEGLPSIAGDLNKRTKLWKEATDIPETTGSLRDIYESVDLEGLTREILLRGESPKELLPIMSGWREQVPQRTLLKQWGDLSDVGKEATGRGTHGPVEAASSRILEEFLKHK